MTTNSENQLEPFRGQLEQLETALDIPPVPGELKSWANTVRKTFDRTAQEFQQQLDQVHPGQLQEIEGQDPELNARVGTLREEDQKNRFWCEKLAKSFAEFEAKCGRAGADEKQVIEEQQKLLEEALSFVVHARRQETAIRTWSQEAFERDTGTGD